MINRGVQFIIYTKNQQTTTDFYRNLLLLEPTLNVPGMTEFQIQESIKLGIMPVRGIQKLLEEKIVVSDGGKGQSRASRTPREEIPIIRCELYLHVDNPSEYYKRAISLGANGISEEKQRDWGDSVAYCVDADGTLLAFARTIEKGV